MTVNFTLNGSQVEAQDGETIWQVAERHGVEIPHLCWQPEPDYRADGNCRACMVEIEGERTLAASCIRKPSEGMKVQTASARAKKSREMVFELLLADQPVDTIDHQDWIGYAGLADGANQRARLGPRERPRGSEQLGRVARGRDTEANVGPAQCFGDGRAQRRQIGRAHV